jgi:hypothetical protein
MNSRPNRQSGAMLVEFAVMAGAVLVPLLLLTSLLGKQIDAKHRYEQGLRYAAFERTTWLERGPRDLPRRDQPRPPRPLATKSAQEIATEVQMRVFAGRDVPIRSDHRNGNINEVMDPMLMRPVAVRLNNQTSAYQPWLVDRTNNNNRPRYGALTQPNQRLPGAAAGGVDTVFDGLRRVTGFSVETNGLYQTRLEVDLDDVAYRRYPEFTQNNQPNGTPLDLRVDRYGDARTPRQLMLLADGWNVDGPRHAESRVRDLVSTDFLNNGALNTVLNVVGWFPMAREFGWLEFGKVDVERVPAQRLGPYR